MRLEKLLEKTRLIAKTVLTNKEESFDFKKLAELMCNISSANVYIIDQEGNILGYAWTSHYDCPIMSDLLKKQKMPKEYVERLNALVESTINFNKDGNCAYGDFPCKYKDKNTAYIPIVGRGERLGTLILARFGERFSTADLLLGEYMATIVGIQILNERNRNLEKESHEKLMVQMALNALSYSELAAIKHILQQLNGESGIVVASRIADEVGVTRSVIVNALRKLESAGVIESRSLGMKGTYIKLIAKSLTEEIQKA